MDSITIRTELKRMEKSDLFELTWQQKMSWCCIGASECGFLIKYKGFNFCLTELLDQGCPLKLEPGNQSEDRSDLTEDQPQISALLFSNLG